MKRPVDRWRPLYEHLRALNPGTLILWADAEEVAQSPLRRSRGALTRAKQELETQDGRTIAGHCPQGFYVEESR